MRPIKNTTKFFLKRKAFIFTFISLFLVSALYGQLTLPYTFQNDSRYQDSEIFIGLVGQFPGMGDVWMDMAISELQTMEGTPNTLQGPAWANHPGSDDMYPDIFTKLSDIPGSTSNIPHGLFGCRIFIAFESPMYLYFHDSGGYAGANLSDENDPNDGIRWEIVELTWGDAGLWTNTSRVDAYQYPMGLEVTGFTGGVGANYAESYNSAVSGGGTPTYKRIGEILPHQTILDMWETNVPQAFYGCKIIKTHSLDGEPIIEQPSKIDDFKESGNYSDYLNAYIDDIWTTYTNKDLLIDIGDRGVWTGRVTGGRFDFVDPADGSQASIYNKPTTQDAIEGKGSLATTEADPETEKYSEDLMIQAQICAAINRHAIHIDTPVGEIQKNHDASRFFLSDPHNDYVRFFHDESVSFESQTYAFAYDDVGDHSSTIQSTYPTEVLVVIGGYGEVADPGNAVLTSIDVSPASVTLKPGQEQVFAATPRDQDGRRMFGVDLTWTSNGGNITDNGLFSADTEGQYVITASSGAINGSASVEVKQVDNQSSGCPVSSPDNIDFTAIVSPDADNPTLTFVPEENSVGDELCLLFYSTEPDNWASVGANTVTPGEPFEISANNGETIYFYYVYSVPSGGENNSLGDNDSFVVGECVTTEIQLADFDDKPLNVFPNPFKY
jgi:hypothetical protein